MSGNSNISRNTGIDLLRFFGAFLVVCIHVGFSSRTYVEPVTRTIVPVFFMISGFFYSFDPVRQKRQIIKTFRLLVISCLIFVAWELVRTLSGGGSVLSLLQGWFRAENLKGILLFNLVPFKGHLWYLSALLYVLILARLLGKGTIKYLYWIIPVLLVLNGALGPYSTFLFGENLNNLYTRNFLLMGLPFFLLGNLVSEHEEKFRKVPPLALLLVSLVLIYAETWWLGNRVGFGNRDFYCFGPFVSLSLFLIARREYPVYLHPVSEKLAEWGRRYSLWVYILHPIAVDLLPEILEGIFGYNMAIVQVYFHIAPLLVFLFSLALALIAEKLMSLSEKRSKAAAGFC